LREKIYDIVSQYKPMTVRQVFYQLVSQGAIDKTEAEYKNLVCRLLAEMRKNHSLPFEWIADNLSLMWKPDTHNSLMNMLELSQETYRRALWQGQKVHVEIWLEKEALAGVLLDVTEDWDVPLYVTRGYPSLSYIYSATEYLNEVDKPAYLYYFGDHDPSGVDISRHVEETLREYVLDDVEIHFERVAVEPRQIAEWHLPTRPTKRTDSRAKNFHGGSVEVDAIAPDKLRGLCCDCIEGHINRRALNRTQRVEAEERATLCLLYKSLEG